MYGLINLMLFVKCIGVKCNIDNVCFILNEIGLDLKFSIYCVIVRILICFFSEKKIWD